jgi:hypothetical protein
MKRWLLLLWLLLPLPVVVWHFGPGQRWLARDRVHTLVRQARAAEQRADWAAAEGSYRDAAAALGQGDARLKMELDLALVRTRFRQGGAVEAIDGAQSILTDPRFPSMPPDLQQEARELAGRIHYYAAWVMRLEGAQRDLWMEAAELARQNFRMLAEDAAPSAKADARPEPAPAPRPAPAAPAAAASTDPPAIATSRRTNLETAVRLQRMSLTELMARPLPEEGQAMAGQGLSEQMARRRGQRGDQPGVGENDEGPPAAGAGTTRFPGGPGS